VIGLNNILIFDLLTYGLTSLGLLFFLAGTVGIQRFPNTHSRLHALTKADNLGLGLIVLGLIFQADGWVTVAKLILIWILALLAAGISSQLVARVALPDAVRLKGNEIRERHPSKKTTRHD